MSDAAALLMFLLVPLGLALRWIVGDRIRGPQRLGILVLVAMVLLVVWMVAELRSDAAFP